MAFEELVTIIMPNGEIQLEWITLGGRLNKQSEILQKEIFAHYSTDYDGWLFALGFCNQRIRLSPSLGFWRIFSSLFARRLTLTPDLENQRGNVIIPYPEDDLSQLQDQLPPLSGSEYFSHILLVELWQSLNKTFAVKIDTYDGTVADFIKEYSPDAHLIGRIYFHLVENKGHDAPFAFLATYSTTLNEAGESRHLPLQYALEEYEGDDEKILDLLVTVQKAAEKSKFIANIMDTGELFHPLQLSANEAAEFLREVPIYEEAGILCRIPNWWKKKGANITASINIGEQNPTMVGLKALLDFRPQLKIGDTEISESEAWRLLQESEGLAFIKNKWVAVDPDKLRETLEAYKKAQKLSNEGGISLLDAMRFAMNPGKLHGVHEDDKIFGVAHGNWLKSIFTKLQQPATINDVKTSKTFKATLRAYQKDGLKWLFYLHKLQLGACLADDMGLGKTVQVLAFLNAMQMDIKKAKSPRQASLLVIPASLLANWRHEIKTFSPALSYFTAHPGFHKQGKIPNLNSAKIAGFDLVLTTYALVQRYKWLQSYAWNYVILDEAQAIKNPGTKQTKAVKILKSNNRIVMTGTPIENKLSDLWSLFDFLNPGLLGNSKEFGRFTKGLAKNPQGYAGLRKTVSPFILRRLKSDKSIISDLPDKVEVKTWAVMSKKQTVLYAEVVNKIKEVIEHADGIQRKGLILSSLMKFKQLCNHPDQYLGQKLFNESESGKFQRLGEICQTIYEKRERVLIFTQFKEMTAPLANFLSTIFKRQGLVLHGSVPVPKRKTLVEKFQGREYVPFFVLSLKAGGVGLNLTAANHVIHFDRWWNPAVENQATDRAFRIGQKKNVMVHKFLTKGTIEEKIDEMLTHKAELSKEVVAASSENWLTELSNEELFELF